MGDDVNLYDKMALKNNSPAKIRTKSKNENELRDSVSIDSVIVEAFALSNCA